MKHEIRIAGAGGQGVVTAGRILAEAAILSGLNATHTQVYGPQSRGGASRSDVVIADGDIGFPLADSIDLLVVLSEEAFARFGADADPAATMLVDEQAVPEGVAQSDTTHVYPVVEAARTVSGGQIAVGVVALGMLQGFAGVVQSDALRSAVAARVPARHREMNFEALDAGLGLVAGGEGRD